MKNKGWYITVLIFLTNILITLVTIFYPISKVLTNPNQINKAFDSINLEGNTINLYKTFLTTELDKIPNLDPQIKAELLNQIDKNIINEADLRKQRIKAVKTVEEKIEADEIPYYTFNFANPIYSIYQQVNETGKSLLSQFFEQQFCTQLEIPSFLEGLFIKSNNDVKCFSLKTLLSQKGKDSNDILFSPTYQVTTSFGISAQNLEKVHRYFLILKYLPPNLLLFTAILYGIILIPLLRYYEKDEWFKAPLKMLIQNILLNLVIWIILPTINRIFEPLNPETFQKIKIFHLNSQPSPLLTIIADTVNKVLYQLSKQMQLFAVITTVIFGTIFLIHWIIWFGTKRMRDLDLEDETKQFSN